MTKMYSYNQLEQKQYRVLFRERTDMSQTLAEHDKGTNHKDTRKIAPAAKNIPRQEQMPPAEMEKQAQQDATDLAEATKRIEQAGETSPRIAHRKEIRHGDEINLQNNPMALYEGPTTAELSPEGKAKVARAELFDPTSTKQATSARKTQAGLYTGITSARKTIAQIREARAKTRWGRIVNKLKFWER